MMIMKVEIQGGAEEEERMINKVMSIPVRAPHGKAAA